LAGFYFQIWPVFTSKFGAFSLPNLAGFHFQIWLFPHADLKGFKKILKNPLNPRELKIKNLRVLREVNS